MITERRLREIEKLQDSEDTDLDFTFFMTELVPELIDEIRRLHELIEDMEYEVAEARERME